MTWAIFPGDTHLRAVVELVSAGLQPSGSERVMAVVGGTLLDEAVTRTLQERLIDDPGIVNNLINVDRPLGNPGPKIDVLYLLGAFDQQTRGALKGIVGVRNFFAHHLDASFDSLDREFLKAMNRLTLQENRTHYPHHLYGPDSKHEIEPITNKKTQFVVNLKLGLIVLMRDRVSHESHTNQPFTEEELREKFQNRREAEDNEMPLDRKDGRNDR